MDDKDHDDRDHLLNCCYCCCKKTKDVEVCVSWDTEYIEEELPTTVDPEDFVQEIESNLKSTTVSGSIDDEEPRHEESSPVIHATSKEEVEILKISFPDERKKKWFFF